MEFETNKNMIILFIVVLVISIGATYVTVGFIKNAEVKSLTDNMANIQDTLNIKDDEINNLKTNGENFTYHILQSMSLLDVSREIRANGNLYFDYAARIWFPQEMYEKVILNCTVAGNYYSDASDKFILAQDYFMNTKQYTSIGSYLTVLDLYVNLTKSAYSLSILQYNATKDISEIAEKLLNESYAGNISELLDEFNSTLAMFDNMNQQGSGQQQDIVDEIEEEYGDFFDPNRRT